MKIFINDLIFIIIFTTFLLLFYNIFLAIVKILDLEYNIAIIAPLIIVLPQAVLARYIADKITEKIYKTIDKHFN